MTEKVDIIRPTSNVQRPTSNVQRPTSSAILFSKILRVLFKIFVSFILALIVLQVFCSVYYHFPQHQVDYDNATDYRSDGYGIYSQWVEGFSWLKLNNEGYTNSFDYERGMKIYALLMGSSHMEAANVQLKENTANVLNHLLRKTVYNIGIGKHNFLKCISHLEAALRKYTPSEYVIIESSSIKFSSGELKKALEDSMNIIPAYDRGFFSYFHKIHFFRLLYRQFPNFIEDHILSRKSKSNSSHNEGNSDDELIILKLLFSKIKNCISHYDVKLIIAYHPSVSLNKDGTLKINGEPETVRQFSDLCEQNGIYFLDMSNRFLDEYEKKHTLPYGFMNTSVGKGHMNRYGHRMFAEEIYKLIQRIEAQS